MTIDGDEVLEELRRLDERSLRATRRIAVWSGRDMAYLTKQGLPP